MEQEPCFLELPVDVWSLILQNLDFPDRLRYTSVSSGFHKLVHSTVSSIDDFIEDLGNLRYQKYRTVYQPEADDLFLQKFEYLYKLNISKDIWEDDRCFLHFTDNGLINLSRLRKLKICWNEKISNNVFSYFSNLTSLSLSGVGNKITNDCFFLLSKTLRKLELDFNETITDDGIEILTNLVKLNLTRNNRISESLLSLISLRDLDISSNAIVTNGILKKLTNLTKLKLANNKMISNEGIQDLMNITDLNLRSNDTITDEGLMKLTNLIVLNISYNLKISDNCVSRLTNLVELNLQYNERITSESVKELINLTSIDYRNCHRFFSVEPLNLTKLQSILPLIPPNISSEFEFLITRRKIYRHPIIEDDFDSQVDDDDDDDDDWMK